MNYQSFDECAAALNRLLDRARKAIAAADDDAADAVFSSLRGFLVDSPDTIDGVKELDVVARQTMRDITVDVVSRSVQSIVDRTADVARLQKQFAKQGATNNSIAAGLRLERVRAVLDSGAQTIAALKGLKDMLPADGDANIAKIAEQIDEVVAALSKLGSTVQTKL